ncbi:MAG: hypothetical protein GY762_09750, partial [Proteobacteria bacterium]|nr:hypothetical protein [Pseudomonadota bacterium]
SKGAFYNQMADDVAGLEQVGGHLTARAARFLSECSILAFRSKLTRKQHAVFVMAQAMADVETSVALCKDAAKSGDELIQAQSRIWAREVALRVPTALLELFAGANVLDEEKMNELVGSAGTSEAIMLQAGQLDDMNLVAAKITAD